MIAKIKSSPRTVTKNPRTTITANIPPTGFQDAFRGLLGCCACAGVGGSVFKETGDPCGGARQAPRGWDTQVRYQAEFTCANISRTRRPSRWPR